MKNELDYPCTCGHAKGCHANNPNYIFNLCGFVNATNDHWCTCGDYTPDNLRYLESKSES